MKTITGLFLVFILASFAPIPALAWSGAGHMVIAAEAYRELSPELQKKVTAILIAHPDYDRWANHVDANTDRMDTATLVFMRASTWADEIRRNGGSEYDHPHWHYIDYPLKPPTFPVEPAPTPNDDVLYGIGQCEKVLSNTNATPRDRAAYLALLIHFIGDMHQPLHCCSLVNDTYPKGDKGGNDFYIKPGNRGIKLHSLWDGLLGTSARPGTELNYAIQIEGEFPRKSLPELTKATTPKEWSLESRAIAVEKAYLHGNLNGSTRADDAPELPAGYTREAKAVAERQAALAGYRLADEIQKVLR
jgi:hypothetical protein